MSRIRVTDAARLTYDAAKFEEWYAGRLIVEQWVVTSPTMLKTATCRGAAAIWIGHNENGRARSKGKADLPGHGWELHFRQPH